MKTTVIFRKFKGGDILALFPYEHQDNYMVLSYMHVGQHSNASYEICVQRSILAKPEEYKNLMLELEQIGYVLDIKKKAQRNKMYKPVSYEK